MDLAERLVMLQARHPVATGVFVAALVGFAGYQAYQIGRVMAEIGLVHGDAARAASEALGG